jgi:hypothetical protein
VRLDQVKILVLDEVDRMLDMGFQPAIARIAAMLPAVRQTLCYSATLEGTVKEVARKYLNNPARVEIGSVLKPAENVELRTFEVEPDKKQELLEHLLGAETGSFLVFVRTKHGADRVARRLSRSGWSATQIHGDRSQAAAQCRAAQLFRGAITVCWWRRMWLPAALTWPTWRMLSTSTCPRWRRTLFTAWAGRGALRRTAWRPHLRARRSAATCARSSGRFRFQMKRFRVRSVSAKAA